VLLILSVPTAIVSGVSTGRVSVVRSGTYFKERPDPSQIVILGSLEHG